MAERQALGPVNVAGLQFESPIMIGGGPVKTVEDVTTVAKSRSAAVVVGSITVEERPGNSGRTYLWTPEHSLNSKGLPNPGLAYYRQNLKEMVRIAHDHGKPLILNVAGFSPEEYVRLSEAGAESGVDGQEINVGCPNVWGEGGQKPIASYHPDALAKILDLEEKELGPDYWASIKLSPYSDPMLLAAAAKVIGSSRLVKAVTTSNTFPNAFSFDREKKPAIEFGNGLAGMAGAAMRPIVAGQVIQLLEALPPHIAVVAVGGISEREHVEDYLRLGANATQLVTAYQEEGPEVFAKILDQ